MKPQVSYDLSEHRHRFAVWAAARAVQRGFKDATTDKLLCAVEKSDIRNEVLRPEFSDLSPPEFDVRHRRWCRSIISALNELEVRNSTYGRAAKLVAIYLKVTVILNGVANSPVSRVVHPPIDNILLKNLAACSDVCSPNKGKWSGTKWTQLNEPKYYELVEQIREAVPPDLPFWMIEKYWNLAASDESIVRSLNPQSLNP
jgi:hypothetical protein